MEEKEETTDKVIFNTFNEKLDVKITLHDVDRTHRIGEPRKTGEKTRSVVA